MTKSESAHIEEFIKGLEYCEKSITESKWNFDNQIDLFSAGLAARAVETGLSMICATEESPDNTLYIMLRHLFETAVRLRYLNLDPNEKICEFVLASTKSTLKAIGRHPKKDESTKVAETRKKLLLEEPNLEVKVAGLQSIAKGKTVSSATIPTVFHMCEIVGSDDLYQIYRLLSSVEHSSWSGLAATVFEREDGKNKIVIGKDFDDGSAEFVWSNAAHLMVSIGDSIHLLNSKRP